MNHQIVLVANASESYALGYDAAGHVTSRRVSYGVGNERVRKAGVRVDFSESPFPIIVAVPASQNKGPIRLF